MGIGNWLISNEAAIRKAAMVCVQLMQSLILPAVHAKTDRVPKILAHFTKATEPILGVRTLHIVCLVCWYCCVAPADTLFVGHIATTHCRIDGSVQDFPSRDSLDCCEAFCQKMH